MVRPASASYGVLIVSLLALAAAVSCASPPPPAVTPVAATSTRQTEAAPLASVDFPTRTPTPVIEPSPAPTITVPAPLPSPSPEPSATPLMSEAGSALLPTPPPTRSRYEISAEIDYPGHSAAVSQTVTYVNRTAEPLPELLFIVEPNRAAGAFILHELNWADGAPVSDFALHTERLRIPLPELLQPGDSITLSLLYDLAIPEQDGPFGYNDRQTNLGDWYPYAPPYQPGRGWTVHQPAHAGEHLVYDVADMDVKIRLDPPVENLVVAAGAPAIHKDGWRGYTLKDARSFALSLSPDYQVASTTVGTVSISSYFFPENRLAGGAALQATAEALQTYSKQFAPYPHSMLTVVQGLFEDGMEYDGLYFLDGDLYEGYSGTTAGYLTAIAVHETAHQWWYGIVANDQAIEPWLDESLATYSELLFYEDKQPTSAAWWWETRVQRFDPSGNVGGTIYDYESYRAYVDAVYLNGALLIDDIRRGLGNEAFQLFLQDYLQRNRERLVTAEDFWSVLEEHGLENTSALKREYFLRP
jgi:Peptidase family M1 domain